MLMSFTRTLVLLFALGGTSAVIASVFMPGAADARVRYALEDRFAVEARVGDAPGFVFVRRSSTA